MRTTIIIILTLCVSPLLAIEKSDFYLVANEVPKDKFALVDTTTHIVSIIPYEEAYYQTVVDRKNLLVYKGNDEKIIEKLKVVANQEDRRLCSLPKDSSLFDKVITRLNFAYVKDGELYVNDVDSSKLIEELGLKKTEEVKEERQTVIVQPRQSLRQYLQDCPT